MRLSLAVIFAGIAMLAGASAHAQSGGARPHPDMDPRPPVAEAYRLTIGSLHDASKGSPLDAAHRGKLLSRRLAALVAADEAESRKNDEPGKLDFDPFINGQDGEVKGLYLNPIANDGRKGAVRATFRSFGKPVTIDFAVVFENGAWRIDDISPLGKGNKPEFRISDILMGKN